MTIAVLIALPIGTYSAIRQDTIGDYIARSFGILALSIPGFWLGTMVVVFPRFGGVGLRHWSLSGSLMTRWETWSSTSFRLLFWA